jgi:hypothetical protein
MTTIRIQIFLLILNKMENGKLNKRHKAKNNDELIDLGTQEAYQKL